MDVIPHISHLFTSRLIGERRLTFLKEIRVLPQFLLGIAEPVIKTACKLAF